MKTLTYEEKDLLDHLMDRPDIPYVVNKTETMLSLEKLGLIKIVPKKVFTGFLKREVREFIYVI